MATVDSPHVDSAVAQAPPRNREEQSDLVLHVAAVLQDNGESTDDTLSTAAALGQALGVSVLVILE